MKQSVRSPGLVSGAARRHKPVMSIEPRKTETIALDEAGLDRAARTLRRGGLVAFPTETVYGLGADATDDTATASIFAAKGRPQFNPLIVHFADADALRRHVVLTDLAQRLSDRFWPGPLTLVLKRRPDSGLSRLVSAGLDTVAVRMPAHGGARDLLRLTGRPIAAPSANASGRLSPTAADHVAASLSGRVDLILDGGACKVGVESTVLDATGEAPVLLRPGGLAVEAVEELTGRRVVHSLHEENAPKSPGMLLSHYAPGLPLRLNAETAQPGEAHLGFGDIPGSVSLSTDGDLLEAAANLFRMLHDLDVPSRYAGIAVAPVPERGLGLAINDRLRRAATR